MVGSSINPAPGSSANMRATQSIERSMALTSFQMSTIAFTAGLGSRINAIKVEKRLEATRADVRRTNDRKAVIERAHFSSIQGRWYIRPFLWEDGSGLFVVDTTNGAWREIVTSPKEPALESLFLNVPLGVVDGGTLVSYGIGLDTENWEKWDNLQAEITTYRRSLFAFDLSGIKWRKAKSYPKKSFATIAAKEP